MFWSNPSTFFIQATVPRTAPEALILRPLASSLPTAGRPRSTSNGFVWDIYTEIHRWEGIILRSSQSKVSMDLSHHSVYGYKPKYLCLSISVHIKIILKSYLSHQHGGTPNLADHCCARVIFQKPTRRVRGHVTSSGSQYPHSKMCSARWCASWRSGWTKIRYWTGRVRIAASRNSTQMSRWLLRVSSCDHIYIYIS